MLIREGDGVVELLLEIPRHERDVFFPVDDGRGGKDTLLLFRVRLGARNFQRGRTGCNFLHVDME